MAVALTRRGLRVFPVSVASRKPLIQGYHGSRPFSLDELRRMPWGEADAIGLALQPGHLALDVDHKNGRKHGHEHLRELEDEYGPLPETVRHPTPSRGLHLLYRLPLSYAGQRLLGHARLSSGEYSHIDLVHARNRYLVLHDPARWLTAPVDPPHLPDSWLPALVHGDHAFTGVPDTDGCRRATLSRTLTEWADEVAQSIEGNRNNTLNRVVFMAACHGYNDESSLAQLRDAARHCGLGDDEIDSAMQSALDGARRKWSFAEKWLSVVDEVAGSTSPRRRAALSAIAAEFARIYMLLDEGQPIGMSVRRLSEVVGLSHQTVHGHVRYLCEQGLLTESRSQRRGEPSRYLLSTPPAGDRKPDTKPLSPSNNLVSTSRRGAETAAGDAGAWLPFGIRHLEGQALARIRAHDAFMRVGSGPSLPPTAANVLASLEDGVVATIAELVDRSGRSRSAVRNAVTALDSGGLVERVGRHGWALVDDVHAGLDRWAEAAGANGRRDERARAHARQRDQMRATTWFQASPAEEFDDSPYLVRWPPTG